MEAAGTPGAGTWFGAGSSLVMTKMTSAVHCRPVHPLPRSPPEFRSRFGRYFCQQLQWMPSRTVVLAGAYHCVPLTRRGRRPAASTESPSRQQPPAPKQNAPAMTMQIVTLLLLIALPIALLFMLARPYLVFVLVVIMFPLEQLLQAYVPFLGSHGSVVNYCIGVL